MMTSLLVPLDYPLILADEQRAINRMAIAVAMVLHTMEKEHSREWLETTLRKGLREGLLTLTIRAIEAADKGDEIADAALREVYAEMSGGALPERGPGHLQVWAYGQRAVLRAPHKRPRGRRWYDNWSRNIAICILVQLACVEYGVDPTRELESRHAKRYPSGISLTVAALARNKIYIEEDSVQRHIWLGLPGELVQQIVAERAV
jgi:hypothetical protein